MRQNYGFSLIELMVAITIIGVLAAMALPTYKTYQAKVQFSQAMDFMSHLKDRSIIYFNTNGVYPTAAQLGYAASGASVSSPSTILPFATAITVDTAAVTGPCAGLATRGAASVTPDPSLVYGVSSGNMYFQWGVTKTGRAVTFCNDNSASNQDWVGTNCTYTNSTLQAFFDSLCQ